MGVASIEEEQNLTWVVWGVVGLLDVKLVVVDGDVLPLVVDSGPGPGNISCDVRMWKGGCFRHKT